MYSPRAPFHFTPSLYVDTRKFRALNQKIYRRAPVGTRKNLLVPIIVDDHFFFIINNTKKNH